MKIFEKFNHNHKPVQAVKERVCSLIYSGCTQAGGFLKEQSFLLEITWRIAELELEFSNKAKLFYDDEKVKLLVKYIRFASRFSTSDIITSNYRLGYLLLEGLSRNDKKLMHEAFLNVQDGEDPFVKMREILEDYEKRGVKWKKMERAYDK